MIEAFFTLVGLGMILAVPLVLLQWFSQRPCPKCMERIDKQATRCPKCTSEIGPYVRTPNSKPWASLAFLAVVGLVLWVWLFG